MDKICYKNFKEKIDWIKGKKDVDEENIKLKKRYDKSEKKEKKKEIWKKNNDDEKKMKKRGKM